MVYRLQLTNDDVLNILDVKYFPGSTSGYTLITGFYEISDVNLMTEFLLPDEVEVKIRIADIRLRSNLTTNKTKMFTEKSLFCRFLGFTQSHSGVLGDVEAFVQLVPGTYKRDKPNIFTDTDKVHLKCFCINGSFVNGIREPLFV